MTPTLVYFSAADLRAPMPVVTAAQAAAARPLPAGQTLACFPRGVPAGFRAVLVDVPATATVWPLPPVAPPLHPALLGPGAPAPWPEAPGTARGPAAASAAPPASAPRAPPEAPAAASGPAAPAPAAPLAAPRAPPDAATSSAPAAAGAAAAAAAPRAGPRISATNVAALVAMGVERGAAVRALAASGDDLGRAAAALPSAPAPPAAEGPRRPGGPGPPAAAASPPREPDLEAAECVVCMDSQADACLVPCAHTGFCLLCASRLQPRVCPICRTEIQEVLDTRTHVVPPRPPSHRPARGGARRRERRGSLARASSEVSAAVARQRAASRRVLRAVQGRLRRSGLAGGGG